METQLKEKTLSMESEKALIFIFSCVEMIVSASRGAGGLSPCWEFEGETLKKEGLCGFCLRCEGISLV